MNKSTILVVDDTPANLAVLFDAICQYGYKLLIAQNGESAIKRAELALPDLILLDVLIPGINGFETCRRLKETEKTKNIPVIFMTASNETEDKVKGFGFGAVDYITKPIQHEEVLARITTHLTLQGLKKQVENQNKDLKSFNENLERLVHIRTKELSNALATIKDLSDDIINRLTSVAEYRDNETGAHIKRIGLYTKELAEDLKMSRDFVDDIGFASELHDIGKIGIHDNILLKPGPLLQEEFTEMKKHTSIGADILSGSPYHRIQMAEAIALTHHERWNGAGYPMGLKGEDIPLEARLVVICDLYDALRMKRPYKTSFDHEKTIEIITKGDGRTIPTHLDPEILNRFIKLSPKFEDIFHTYNDGEMIEQ